MHRIITPPLCLSAAFLSAAMAYAEVDSRSHPPAHPLPQPPAVREVNVSVEVLEFFPAPGQVCVQVAANDFICQPN